MSLALVMARQVRVEYPGAVYHVMSRGNQGNASTVALSACGVRFSELAPAGHAVRFSTFSPAIRSVFPLVPYGFGYEAGAGAPFKGNRVRVKPRPARALLLFGVVGP